MYTALKSILPKIAKNFWYNFAETTVLRGSLSNLSLVNTEIHRVNNLRAPKNYLLQLLCERLSGSSYLRLFSPLMFDLSLCFFVLANCTHLLLSLCRSSDLLHYCLSHQSSTFCPLNVRKLEGKPVRNKADVKLVLFC